MTESAKSMKTALLHVPNVLLAMQCFIAGMGAFLVLVEVGKSEIFAANVLLLAFAAGIISAIAPAVEYSYEQLKAWWSGHDV